MVNIIKNFLERIFSKNKKLMLCDYNIVTKMDLGETTKNEFLINLRKDTYLNQDDGNGYGIIKNIDWESLI